MALIVQMQDEEPEDYAERVAEAQFAAIQEFALTAKQGTEALRSVITNACPFKVLQKQKHYMHRYMRKLHDMKVCTYVHSLVRINIEEIPHLPPFARDQRLSEDEIIEIILNVTPNSWSRRRWINRTSILNNKAFCPSYSSWNASNSWSQLPQQTRMVSMETRKSLRKATINAILNKELATIKRVPPANGVLFISPIPTTVWTIPGGQMMTTKKSRCTFVLPKFHQDRVIEWDINISSGNFGVHDMIIGRDILQGLGMKFDFTNLAVEWDGTTIPMQDVDSLTNEACHIQDPDAVAEATDCVKAILNAKYEKADLAEVAQSATHLSETERQELHQFLNKYEDLFDGSLGKWNMGAYDIELRPDVMPYQPCKSIPHSSNSYRHAQDRSRATLQSRSPEKGKSLRMGSANIHYTKEGWICPIHLQLLGVKQADQAKAIPDS
jgi:hypothetical protein